MRYDTLGNTDFILTDEVTSIVFSYYFTTDNSRPTDTSDVAYIEFELILNNGNSLQHQRTRVALRNQPVNIAVTGNSKPVL